MSFSSQNTPKSRSAAAKPQTPLRELTALSKPLWLVSRGRLAAGEEWRVGRNLGRGKGGERGKGEGTGKVEVGGWRFGCWGERRPCLHKQLLKLLL